MSNTNTNNLPAPVTALESYVEPLNRATENFLKPPRLRDTDYLFIWMDAKHKRFQMDLRCMERQESKTITQADAGPLFANVVLETKPECWNETTWPGVSHGAEDFMYRIPEKKQLDRHSYAKRHHYEVSATDMTALLVKHCWPENQVFFRPPGLTSLGEFQFPESKEAKTLYEYLLLRFFGQADRARQIAAFKEFRTMPNAPDGWLDRNDRPLADYQKFAAWIGLCSPMNLALFADRGTGKTAVAIAAMAHLARESRQNGGPMLRFLVICPGQVRTNWEKEIDRFTTVAGKATIIKGTAIQRIRLVTQACIPEDDCAFSVAIVSFDSASVTEALQKVPWDAMILDESHKYKSEKTNRWSAIKELRETSTKIMPMTGTPIGNSPMDLWTQLESLGTGLSGFEKFGNFAKFYGKWTEVGGKTARGIEKLTGLQNIPLLQERLARCSFQITKAEAGLELPEKVYDYYEVEMSKYHAELYARVEKEVELEISNKLSGEVNNLTVQNILVQLLRLAQITSGHVRWDASIDPMTGEVIKAGKVEQVVNPNPKVQGVMEMLTDSDRDPLGKTIIWCSFVPDIEILMETFEKEGIKAVSYYGKTSDKDRIENERLFNEDPECRVIVCNPKTASEGLNLVGYDWWNEEHEQKTYTDHEIFFSCNWSSLERGQAEDRAHRRGTRQDVRITDLVIPGTIDIEMRERVRGKIEMANATLDLSAILDAIWGIKKEINVA